MGQQHGSQNFASGYVAKLHIQTSFVDPTIYLLDDQVIIIAE